MTSRKPFLNALVAALAADDVVVSCLGANARWLPHMSVPVPVFALCDSMSAAVPLALGMALSRADRHVIALEGDGSLLMSPNVLATLAAARPSTATHPGGNGCVAAANAPASPSWGPSACSCRSARAICSCSSWAPTSTPSSVRGAAV